MASLRGPLFVPTGRILKGKCFMLLPDAKIANKCPDAKMPYKCLCWSTLFISDQCYSWFSTHASLPRPFWHLKQLFGLIIFTTVPDLNLLLALEGKEHCLFLKLKQKYSWIEIVTLVVLAFLYPYVLQFDRGVLCWLIDCQWCLQVYILVRKY